MLATVVWVSQRGSCCTSTGVSYRGTGGGRSRRIQTLKGTVSRAATHSPGTEGTLGPVWGEYGVTRPLFCDKNG